MSFRSYAVPEFWDCYDRLPESVRSLADKKYALFQEDPFHPSLGFQRKGEVWAVDIGRSYRRLLGARETIFTGTGSVSTKPTTNYCGAKVEMWRSAAN